MYGIYKTTEDIILDTRAQIISWWWQRQAGKRYLLCSKTRQGKTRQDRQG